MEKLALLAVVLLLAGCSVIGNRSPSSPSVAESAGARPAAVHQAGSTARPKVASSTRLTGTGSKRGPAVVLQGDYVLKDSVITKPGCRFAVYLLGFAEQPLDAVDTDASGSSSTSIPEYGLALGSYRIKIKSSGCGRWSVSLSRP